MTLPTSSLVKPHKVSLGGHEKFVFRYGWLKKGVDALLRNPAVFAAEDAIAVLGVGKNMVRSIRFWGLALGVFEEVASKKPSSALRVSRLGQALFGDEGWDPYLEDPATLWLLHWQLATNPARALVWHLAFCDFAEIEFTKPQMITFVARTFDRLGVEATRASVERDVEVFLRTYVPAMRKPSEWPAEETMDCPLAELGLLGYMPEEDVYRFNPGAKVSLPTAIFGYALLTFLAQVAARRRVVALDECLYRRGSPGQVFRLDENSVAEHMEALEALTQGTLSVRESVGVRQIYLQVPDAETLSALAFDLLNRHYAGHGC
ncbi:MAG: DUF4007 family protein [Anaerolineae bacterium]|nr:DUF4007 family protein [Anaerolineae bacterium]